MNDLRALREAIRAKHGCDSTRIESVPVIEKFDGKIVWEGTVEVFSLIGHSKAKRVYGWSYRDGNITRCITVLEIPPVDSPQSAVKVAIASKARLDQH